MSNRSSLPGTLCVCSRSLTVPFALGEEHPGYPSRLIGLGYTGTIRPAALAHALEPSAAGILLLVDLPYDRVGSMDEELTQVAVAPFADAQ